MRFSTFLRRRQRLLTTLSFLLVLASLMALILEGAEASRLHKRATPSSTTKLPSSSTKRPITTTELPNSSTKRATTTITTTKLPGQATRHSTTTTNSPVATNKYKITYRKGNNETSLSPAPTSATSKLPEMNITASRSGTFKFNATEKRLLEELLSLKRSLDQVNGRVKWDEEMNPAILEDISYFDANDSYEFYTQCAREEMVNKIVEWIAKLKALEEERKKGLPKSTSEKPVERTTTKKPEIDSRNDTRPTSFQSVQFKFNSTTRSIIETLTHNLNSTTSDSAEESNSSSHLSHKESLTSEQMRLVQQVRNTKSRLAKATATSSNRALVKSNSKPGNKTEMGADMLEKMIHTSHVYSQLADQNVQIEKHLNGKQNAWLRELYNRVEKNLSNATKFESEEKMQNFIENLQEVEKIFNRLKGEYSTKERYEAFETTTSSDTIESVSATDDKSHKDSKAAAGTKQTTTAAPAVASGLRSGLEEEADDEEDDKDSNDDNDDNDSEETEDD